MSMSFPAFFNAVMVLKHPQIRNILQTATNRNFVAIVLAIVGSFSRRCISGAVHETPFKEKYFLLSKTEFTIGCICAIPSRMWFRDLEHYQFVAECSFRAWASCYQQKPPRLNPFPFCMTTPFMIKSISWSWKGTQIASLNCRKLFIWCVSNWL